MSFFQISPSRLQGRILIPPSKSHTLRAILFALFGKGKSIIHNYLHSPDTDAMIKATMQLGARLQVFPDRLEIIGCSGELKTPEDVIQAGNSGQVLRFIGAISSLLPTYTIITGDFSIRHQRQIEPLLDGLRQLGAFAVSSKMDGYAPIIVQGKLKPGQAAILGDDSQPVSALLMAASFLEGKSEIQVQNPGERPWIDLTLSWLEELGAKIENQNYGHYTVHGSLNYEGFERSIPGDFSSSAYPIVAAVITNSELTLENIDMFDVQGDKKLIDILVQMGAKIEHDTDKKTLTVKKGGRLKGMKIDINDCIDMITILPVLACFAEGRSEIVNGSIARKKESDRIHAISKELKKMGAKIEEREDGMVIEPSFLTGALLESYNDHRMTLALAVAAMGAKGDSHIEGVSCISKTYPTFKRDFQALGARFT